MIREENEANMVEDSQKIFEIIRGCEPDDFAEAKELVIQLFTPDESYSRAGICDAVNRLEVYFKDRKPESQR